MRIHILFISLLCCNILSAQKITTRFEQSNGTQTPTYLEAIDWWKKLDAISPIVNMKAMGMTDAGYPLHLILVSADGDFNIA